jgi:hypothetical protein
MVIIDGFSFGSGYILFAASYSEEAVEDAKKYCKKYNLTPNNVKIKKTKQENTDHYELVLVEVI